MIPRGRRFAVTLVVLAFLGIAADARISRSFGATLIDTGIDSTFSPPFPGSLSPWSLTPGRTLGGKFTLGSAHEITEIQTFMTAVNLNPTFTIQIWSDFGNLPATSLFSQDFVVSATHSTAAWESFSGLSWTLGAGDYWMVMTAKSCSFGFCGNWYGEAPNPMSKYAEDFGSFWVALPSPSGNLSVRIYGDPALDTSPVPLPGALPLFLSGLGALGIFRWRKARRKQA